IVIATHCRPEEGKARWAFAARGVGGADQASSRQCLARRHGDQPVGRHHRWDRAIGGKPDRASRWLANVRGRCVHRPGDQNAGRQARSLLDFAHSVETCNRRRSAMTMLAPRYRRLAALAILLMVLALPVAAVISLSGLQQPTLSEIAERRAGLAPPLATVPR